MKRGQVTIFVIIGLVAVILIGLAIFLFSSEPQVPVEKVPPDLNEEINPLIFDIEFCMAEIGKEGFKEIGANGGYIESPPILTGIMPEHLNTGIELYPGSGIKVPYWYSLASDPTCQECRYSNRIPPLEGDSPVSIEAQVSEYIAQRIPGCMNNFEEYAGILDITPLDDPKVDINFNDGDTEILLNWPLEISSYDNEATANMNNFSEKIDLKMRQIYDFSIDILSQIIIDQQAADNLAKQVTDILGLGSKEALIPPRAGGVDTSTGAPNMWRKSEVQSIIKSQLAENTNYLQVSGTREHFKTFAMPEFNSLIYENFIYYLPVEPEIADDVKVRFQYLDWWPIYLNINPGYGEIIMPTTRTQNVVLFTLSMTRYDFDYDVAYPVLVTLEEDTAFNGEGYLFQYAIEGNIRRSDTYGAVNTSLFYDDSDLSLNLNQASQRTIPVMVNTYSGYDGLPVPNVTVTYECLGQDLIVGTTELDDGKAIVENYLPPCLNGRFVVFSNNAYGDPLTASIYEGVENEFDIEVYPEKEVELVLKKKPYVLMNPMAQEDTWEFRDATVSIDPDEEIQLIMYLMKDNETQNYIKTLYFENGNTSADVKLVPGEYNVILMSTKDVDIQMQAETVGNAQINASNFTNKTLVGGLLFDGQTSDFLEIKPQDLNENNRMIMYYAGYDSQQIIFQRNMIIMAKVLTATKDNREALLPDFE